MLLAVPEANAEGLSCKSATLCLAVGSQAQGTATHTLVESWNGRSWSKVPSPDPTVDFLNALSCTSATSCVAIGSTSSSTQTDTVAESWNGTSWSLVPSPGPGGAHGSGLAGVSCTAPASCVAVGAYSTSSEQHTLVASWNGTTWVKVPSPKAARL